MWVWSFAGRNDTITSARGQSQPVEIASLATSTRTCVSSWTRCGSIQSTSQLPNFCDGVVAEHVAHGVAAQLRDTRRRSCRARRPMSSGSGVFGVWSTSSGWTTSRRPCVLAYVCQRSVDCRSFAAARRTSTDVEVAGLGRDVEHDGVLDQAGLLDLEAVDRDRRQRAAVAWSRPRRPSPP